LELDTDLHGAFFLVHFDVRDSELKVGQGPVLERRVTRRVGIFAALFEEQFGVAGVVGSVEVGELAAVL